MKNKITWEDLERKDIAIHTPSKELMVKVANVIADKYGDITYEQNIINSRENGDVCQRNADGNPRKIKRGKISHKSLEILPRR